MKLQTVLTVFVALSCVASVGVASTTLETSLSSDPDDAVDLNYDIVPISPDDASRLQRAMTSQSDSGSDSTEAKSKEMSREQRRSVEAADSKAQQSESAGGGSSQRNQQSNQQKSTSKDGNDGIRYEPTWWEMLLSLLRAWLPVVLALALAVGLAVGVARYGDRIREWVLPSGSDGDQPQRPLEPAPRNEVERAWVTVLSRAGVEDPWRQTPAECAAAAVDNGLDPEGVARLRSVFEEVRYGGREVTETHRNRLQDGLSRLDGWRGER
jgi:hypothetical protein